MNGTPCSEIRKKESVSWKASETEIEWVESKVKKNDNDNLELNPSEKYILFVVQEANFCPHDFFVPKENFLKVRQRNMIF